MFHTHKPQYTPPHTQQSGPVFNSQHHQGGVFVVFVCSPGLTWCWPSQRPWLNEIRLLVVSLENILKLTNILPVFATTAKKTLLCLHLFHLFRTSHSVSLWLIVWWVNWIGIRPAKIELAHTVWILPTQVERITGLSNQQTSFNPFTVQTRLTSRLACIAQVSTRYYFWPMGMMTLWPWITLPKTKVRASRFLAFWSLLAAHSGFR